MLAADLVASAPSILATTKAREALIMANAGTLVEVTPSISTTVGTKVKSAFSGKGLLIAGGVGFVGLLGYLLFVPPKKKASAPVAGINFRRLFRRRR